MLASLLGIRLILWMGQNVPTPAPVELLSALTKVVVINDSENGDGFQLTFTLGKDKTGEYSLLRSTALDPFNRVIIGTILGVVPEVLIDGIITHHQVAPSNEPGMSTLTVIGKDVSVMLDLEEKNDKFENQPDFVIVTRLLANYAKFGVIPLAQPTTDVPIMLQRIPRQCETDSKFIKRMARRNGFVFYIEPVSFGVNKAYWGPENRMGIPQPALTLNMGEFTNIRSLNFSNDSLAPVGTEGSFVEPITKMSLPLPQLPSLRLPPLVQSTAKGKRKVISRNTANQNPSQAATSVVAALTNSPDPVKGEGELETVRYGHVLRARKLVGVRGAGRSYDGNYYVKSVTHTIIRGDYTQKFTLTREGTGSLLPVVVP